VPGVRAGHPGRRARAIEPFRIAVPDAELDELRARLRATRWPEREPVADDSQGVPLDRVRALCAHWADGYDWRATEAELNALPQFRAQAGGLGIHLLHVRSRHPDALPLVLTHGWPGSIVEFLGVLELLTDPPDPRDAFHVVCPSLPGYGFSDKPREPGWGIARIAAAWAELMARLGYDRYGAQGGDWGSIVATRLAALDREHVCGIHLNMALVAPEAIRAAGEPTAEERAALAAAAEHRRFGTGYSTQQATRPQTLGYGLVDSPVGQCAWIVEKLRAWTDPESVLTRDALLDNVMLHWLPGTGASSARLYWESLHDPAAREPIDAPTGLSVFPKEIFPLSRRWAEQRFSDLRHYRRLDRGGHFAAFEQPELFVDEVRAFFRLVR